MEETITVLPAESYFCGSGKVILPERPLNGSHTTVCRVAIVSPGFPDTVIKISPAEHEREFVWVDRQPGIERWADINRIMEQYGPRNRRIPKPVSMHSNPQQSVTPTASESDVPLVELENGQILKAPPKVFMQPEPAPKTVNTEISVMKADIEKLAKTVNSLVEALGTGTEKRGPGRPKKE